MFDFCNLRSYYLNLGNSGHYIFASDVVKLAVTLHTGIDFLLKLGDLFAIRCHIVGAEFG